MSLRGVPNVFLAVSVGLASCSDFRKAPEASSTDAGEPADAGTDSQDASSFPVGRVTGGPCRSGATGAAAFTAVWIDKQGTAVATLEVQGLPDPEGFKIGGFLPDGSLAPYDDPYFGGGVAVRDGSYVDVTFSTRGLPVIRTATLAIEARSFDVRSSGSFAWQTSVGSGKTPTGGMLNSRYNWSSADVTQGLTPDTASMRLRIRSGPPSMKLVISRIELCLDTD